MLGCAGSMPEAAPPTPASARKDSRRRPPYRLNDRRRGSPFRYSVATARSLPATVQSARQKD
uniref:Uncharacterized protein n=1 Tax=Hyaloperonospora arabidopsidis (strain Emoy2) TaxID=559515 RepID=M4BKN6_HYAAE